MADATRTLAVYILGDEKSLTGSLDRAGTKGEQVARRLTTAFAAIGVGVGVEKIVGLANSAEQSAGRTAAAIESTGGAAGLTAKQIVGLADKYAVLDGMAPNTVQQTENILLAFTKITDNGPDKTFDRATAAALDMSAAFTTAGKNISPAQAATAIGKALNDPIKGMTALSRLGVTFDAQQSAQIKRWVELGQTGKAQTFILDEVMTRYGGTAAATATDTQKAGAALTVAGTKIGTDVIPAVNTLARAVEDVAGALSHLPSGVTAGIIGLGAVALIGGKTYSAVMSVREALAGMGKSAATGEAETTTAVTTGSGEQITELEAVTKAAQERNAALAAGSDAGAGGAITAGGLAGAGTTVAGVAASALLFSGDAGVDSKAQAAEAAYQKQVDKTKGSVDKLRTALEDINKLRDQTGHSPTTPLSGLVDQAQKAVDQLLKHGSVQQIAAAKPDIMSWLTPVHGVADSLKIVNQAIVDAAKRAKDVGTSAKSAGDSFSYLSSQAIAARSGVRDLYSATTSLQTAAEAYAENQREAAGVGAQEKDIELAALVQHKADLDAIHQAEQLLISDERTRAADVQAVADAEYSEAAAVRGIDAAKRTLATDIANETTLTKNLAQARTDAARALEQSANTAAGNKLSVTAAEFALEDAKRAAAQGPTGGSANDPNAQAKLNLAVEQAALALKEAEEQASQSEQDYTAAKQAGIDQSPQVLAAQRAIADNYQTIADASQGVQDAYHNEQAASRQVDSARQALIDQGQKVQQDYADIGTAAQTAQSDMAIAEVQAEAVRLTAQKNSHTLYLALQGDIDDTIGKLGKLGIAGDAAYQWLDAALIAAGMSPATAAQALGRPNPTSTTTGGSGTFSTPFHGNVTHNDIKQTIVLPPHHNTHTAVREIFAQALSVRA